MRLLLLGTRQYHQTHNGFGFWLPSDIGTHGYTVMGRYPESFQNHAWVHPNIWRNASGRVSCRKAGKGCVGELVLKVSESPR
jgi:hypothetical protein